jgi:uncharacterized damage-inducible protein DinB
MNRRLWNACGLVLAAGLWAFAQAPKQPPTPAQSIGQNFNYVNRQILDMAKDFPEDKYGYKPKPEMRSFGEVILHIMAGNTYAAKVGRGENVKWDDQEVDPKKYHGKAEIVAAFQKSVDEATATLKAIPAEQFTKSIAPWISVIEHSGEHYGLLVAYYRLNGIVPPASRKK